MALRWGPRPEAKASLDFERLYERESRTLLLYFARRTADPEIALDLWAETFARALEHRTSWRGSTDQEASGWLFGIARTQLATFYRKGATERRAMDRLRLERPALTDDLSIALTRSADLGAMRAQVAGALESLSPSVRDAISLRIVDELDYAEVAATLGISEGAARVRVSRGLSALADLIDHPKTEVGSA